MPNKKYKAIVNGVEKTFSVGEAKYNTFIAEHPEATLIEDFQNDSANATDPNGESVNTGSNWDQGSLVTSNTEDPNPIDGVRFVKFKDGSIVYEDDYLEKYAGTGRYPATFDDYAKKFKTTPRVPSPADVVLDEVVIKAKPNEKQKVAQNNAVNYIQTIDSKNEVTLKGDIGESYFDLTDEFSSNAYTDGELIPRSIISAEFVNNRPKKNKKTWYPETRMKGQYINSLEEDQKASMGEAKWNQWQAIKKAAGDTVLTRNNIAEFIDLAQIDETTKSQVVNTAKNKAAELFIYDNDLTEREQEDMLMNMPYSPETKSAMRQEIAIRKQDAIDFKNKTGRPLVRETNLAGRIYKPFIFSENRGVFDKIIAKENKGLKTDFTVIQEDANKFKEAQDNFVKVRSQYEIKLSKIEDKIKAYSADDLKFMSPNEVALRNSLITEYNDTLSLANSEAMQSQWKSLTASRAELSERSDALTSRAKQLNDLNIGTSAIGKSYELGDQFAQVMEESFLGTSAMLGGSVFKLIGNIATIGKTEDEAMQNSFYRDMKNAKMAAVDYNARLQTRREDYLPSRIEWDDEEAGWGDYVSTMLVENSPSILTAMGTLGAGSAGILSAKAAANVGSSVFFVMEAGGQMSQLEMAQRNAGEIVAALETELLSTTGEYERRNIQTQIQEQKDILSLSQWQKSLSSLVYGGTAAVAERFGSLEFINNFQKYSRAIGVSRFQRLVGNSMGRTLAKTTGVLGGIGMGAGIEVLEEGMTLIGQNLSDVSILGQDKNIFEGLDKDFLANTLATSMAISGPVASQSIYSTVKAEVMSRKEAREESKMRDEIMGLQNEINGDKLTEEERKRARRKKFELMTELGLQNTEVVLKINDMTSKEFEDVTELNREMRALEKEAAQLGAQGDVSGYSQKELANLKSKYEELISQREDILERQSNELNELFPDKKGLSVNSVYNANLYNFAKNIIKNNKGTKSQNFTTTADAVKFIKENHSTWYSELSEGDKKDFDAGRWGGINIGNNIYMNQESVFNDIASGDLRVGQMAAMSPLHELGHIQTVKAGIIKDGKFVGDAQAMIAGVTREVGNLFNQKKVSAKDYKLFQDRMAQYTDANTGQVDADELIQLIGDFTNMGILPRSSFNSIFEIKNFVSNLMKRENGEAEMYFRFDKPENVFGFVNSWTKKAIGGRQLAGVDDKDDGKVKLSKSQAQLEKTKSKFKELESNFQSGRSQNVIAGELFAMVETQISNRFNLKPQTRMDLRDDVIERLYAAKETTKWDGRGNLYGFINGRIAKRILDALRADENYLSSIDNNQFDALEKAAGVIAEETVVKEDNKPVFKKLISSRVISTEALVNIKNKVLSTVRTLKAAIDSNTSVNKTVSPLIAEIKKEMGKQADIDLKKEMGGKKDDQLKKFLIKNKKAILQNMTTTWLMTAMPGAVQKRVDGVWTSNWKGKKIDRESVKDNNAGRTSGADMVRRKPNVASMEDAEFLGYILDSKGNPLRGRKESLAKAMAEEISLEVFNQQLQDDGSDISKAFEQNQTLKGVELLDNYIAEVAKQSERGNVKFSKSVSANDISIIKSRADLLKKKLLKANIKLTSKSLLPLLLDIYPEMDEKKLKAFATEAIVSIQRYIKKIDLTNKVNFGEFIFEGISLKENNSNLLKFFGIQKTEVKSLGGLYNNADLVAKQRELEFTYNNNLVSKEGEEGLLKILRWGRGHQATSGKIGGGRNQSYAGNPDYIDNNLNNIPDVEVVYKKGKTTSIKAVYYKGIEIEDWKNKIKTPQQKAAGGIESFRKDAQVREDAAREAWVYLTDFLQHVKDNGNQIDWTMTMMSLKSNMSSVLKAAAPVKYYFEGTHKGPLRYEHMIPTEYMVLKLSDYYWNGKKFDLNSLRDKYNVAIIPITMDDNFNILTQSQMNSEFDPMVNSEIDRYFNKTTFGYPNMFPIEVLTGKDKGKIEGKDWVAFNNILKPQAAKFSKAAIAADKAMNAARLPDYTQNPKKIRVFDFDDTLARTKSNVLYTMPGEVPIYHGGSISSIRNITGSFVYFSQDQSQASEYAKGNDGEVNGFVLNESDIASEEDVFKVIRELGIQPKEKGWTVDDSRLYELIDDRFEQSFSKSDLSKLTKALANKGIKASRFTDSDLKSGKDTDNIVVFDKKSIKEQAKIDAATFAKEAGNMEAEGAVWDFSEFSKVMNGKKGPLFEVAKIIADKNGTDDLFVLTARPQDAAGPIQEFLSELGLDIPLENITGLSDGRPQAKADWMLGKFADGYNDFYFTDDHLGNVKAVKDVLSVLDVKSKVQQARAKFSKSFDPTFNQMMERNKGISAVKEFSKVVAKRRGANIGKYKFLVSSADDFRGLTSYTFAGKGKQGEADQQFFEDALLTPYFQGINAIESERQTVKNDFRALSKKFKATVKKLGKLIPDGDFTYDQAIRVYLWTKAGIEVPGISKRDQAKLNKLVAEDSDLVAFADAALLSSKKDAWIEPGEFWDSKTLLSDLNDLTEKVNRKEYLAEFIANVDIIFSEKNLNKVEALYGTRHREALEDAIYSMKNGTNRPSGSNKITNRWNNWVNNSIGAIMFFNRRSAVMQLLSTVNFINWSDNNPVKAGLAFANQPQYWKDFVMIFNSDKLKQRRGGLKSDVQEAEIANAAKGAKNKASAILSYLLKIGFTPTQIADSFAISMGGASMYRNRVKTYQKQGLDQKAAEEKAWLDFTKLSDETQQSGDPALVSQQQRSTAGRLILSFQNTTMQYTRLMKKAGQDLVNGRGDAKTNISKIIYYGAVQNFIFNALSNALFALIPGFDNEDDNDDDDEAKQRKEDDKSARILHGMMDSLLRGTGIRGAVITTIKNTIRQYFRQEEKGFTANHAYTIVEAANLSPAIGSKLRKINTAIQTKKFENDVIQKRGFDITIDGKFNLSPTYNIIGSLAAATLNIPLDRAISEAQAVSEALDNRNSKWQRVALAMGWRTWDVGALNEEHDLIKTEAKAKRKVQGKIKAKETRENNKKTIKKLENTLTAVKFRKYKKDTKGMSITNRIKWLKKNK